jgi:hypothetical protein
VKCAPGWERLREITLAPDDQQTYETDREYHAIALMVVPERFWELYPGRDVVSWACEKMGIQPSQYSQWLEKYCQREYSKKMWPSK